MKMLSFVVKINAKKISTIGPIVHGYINNETLYIACQKNKTKRGHKNATMKIFITIMSRERPN
jgi:hypothetical protein